MAALALSEAGALHDQEFPLQAWALARLLGSFGARMAAAFTLAVSTASLRVGSLPRWLVLAGYLTGALLLLTPPLPRWAQLLFPQWVMAISIQVLLREHEESTNAP